MKKVEKFLPGEFMRIKEIMFFRLKSGEIAVENFDNLTISASKKDIVEKITIKCGSSEAEFWKIGNKIFPLVSKDFLLLPEDATFEDLYFSDNYPEGVYVKYVISQNCGILYVSDTEVSIVISHENEYEEINFKKGFLYVKTRTEENRYQIIGESGKLLFSSNEPCIIADKIACFYSKNQLAIGDRKVNVPYEIKSVNCIEIEEKNFSLIEVITDGGSCFFTTELSFVFGPTQNKILKIDSDKDFCLLGETKQAKEKDVYFEPGIFMFKKLFYIKKQSSNVICKSISCAEGILVSKSYNFLNVGFCVAKNKELYYFSKEGFELIANDVDGDSISSPYFAPEINFEDFLIYKKGRPIYYCKVSCDPELVYHGTLDIIQVENAEGIWGGEVVNVERLYICKSKATKTSLLFNYNAGDNLIILVEPECRLKGSDGFGKSQKLKVKLLGKGEDCYKKIIEDKFGRKEPYYIVEKEDNVISLYNTEGEKV